MLGSRVRSQDATRTRLEPQNRKIDSIGSVAQGPPSVQWTEPVRVEGSEASTVGQPAIVALPPPPSLPGDPGSISKADSARPAAEAPLAEARDSEAAEPSADNPIATIQELVAKGQERLAPITNYQVRMNRQERVGGDLQPAEDLLLSVRREPKAIRLEWRSGKNQGREVLYSTVETAGQIQIRMPGSLIPKVTLAPDSPLVLRSSRHPIDEAGLETILENLENSLRPHLEGTPTRAEMAYQGVETLEDLGRSGHKIVERREDGEVWVVHLDAETSLPVSVKATGAGGELLEHYTFDDLKTDLPDLAKADAFDPAKRWGDSGQGFLSRMARSNPQSEKSEGDPNPR